MDMLNHPPINHLSILMAFSWEALLTPTLVTYS